MKHAVIDHAIFDMDGLLIDSEPLWLKAQQSSLQSLYDLKLTPLELLPFQGATSHSFCVATQQAYPTYNIEVDALLDALLTTMEGCIAEAPLLLGALELIEALVTESTPIAIASSSPLSLINKVIKYHQLPINIVASGTEVNRSKPHPAVFELAAQRLNAPPRQCRVWEDSVNGVIAGKAASMNVVAVPEANHPQLEKFSIADYVHTSLQQSLSELIDTDIQHKTSL